ncbi:hypothetical protein ACTZWW_07975 [Salinarimonas sp. NSM]|uniref:hypothetical protein n=1 Tax=Salinarimonas sp. NSM TaxID=3458003 RepID=UPI0040354BD9
MAADSNDPRRDRPNLKDEDVGRLRNRQRSGPAPVEEGGAEGSLTQREAWGDPGGEAQAYRAATSGAGGDASGHGELTARETPETTRHLSGDDREADDGSGGR